MTRIQVNFNLYAADLSRAVAFYVENFSFEYLGDLEGNESSKWAALKVENAIIWLGEYGATSGLVLLIENNIDEFVLKMKRNQVVFFRPEEFKDETNNSNVIVETSWGKHAWFFDSEHNSVMLFEPMEG